MSPGCNFSCAYYSPGSASSHPSLPAVVPARGAALPVPFAAAQALLHHVTQNVPGPLPPPQRWAAPPPASPAELSPRDRCWERPMPPASASMVQTQPGQCKGRGVPVWAGWGQAGGRPAGSAGMDWGQGGTGNSCLKETLAQFLQINVFFPNSFLALSATRGAIIFSVDVITIKIALRTFLLRLES